MNYLICNIGNRDIEVSSETTIKGIKVSRFIPRLSVREVSECICLDLDAYMHVLRFPLLEPVLQYVKDFPMHTIVLIGTDQAHETHRGQDTVFFCKIVKQWLMGHSWKPRTPRVITLSIRDNPADYDDMNAWYRKQFRRFRESFTSDGTIYLALTGGTPQMNTFTLLHGAGLFGLRAEAIYTKPRDQRPIPLRVGQDLVLQRAKDELRSMLESYDYYAACNKAQIIAEQIGYTNKCRILLHLLTYAHARISFDFEKALAEIEQAIKLCIGEQRRQLDGLRKDLYNYLDGEAIDDLLKEQMSSIKLKAKRGEFIDMLARVFRFQEAAYRQLMGKFGVKFSNDKRLDLGWVRAHKDLADYLDSYRVNGQRLEYTRDVNRKVMEVILTFYAKEAGSTMAMQAGEILSRIESLAGLRNKTPTAHGFKGVSKEMIEREYNRSLSQFFGDMDEILSFICVDSTPEPPFYKRVNDLAWVLVRGIG